MELFSVTINVCIISYLIKVSKSLIDIFNHFVFLLSVVSHHGIPGVFIKTTWCIWCTKRVTRSPSPHISRLELCLYLNIFRSKHRSLHIMIYSIFRKIVEHCFLWNVINTGYALGPHLYQIYEIIIVNVDTWRALASQLSKFTWRVS